jgi:peptidyl-prolyl cis-trans isomerase C
LQRILMQAHRAGIEGTILEILADPRLVSLIAQRFNVPEPSSEACERYYRAHEDAFRDSDRYLGRQIVLRWSADESERRDEICARAERLIAILHFDPRMFTDLLASYSSDENRDNSGRLGPVAPGALPPPLETALFALRPGKIHPTPVATEFGLHVIVLDRIIPGELPPFSAIRRRVGAILRQEARNAAASRHLARLARRYRARRLTGIRLSPG